MVKFTAHACSAPHRSDNPKSSHIASQYFSFGDNNDSSNSLSQLLKNLCQHYENMGGGGILLKQVISS